MQITEITVSYGLTQSLADYCNIKPHVSFKVQLAPEDDPDAVFQALREKARADVEEQVDAALERDSQPARYSSEPRYQVIRTRRQRDYLYGKKARPLLPDTVAILPNGAKLPNDDDWYHVGMHSRKLRHAHALRVAAEYAAQDDVQVVDCADGDLSRLPVVVIVEETPAATEEPPSHDDAPVGVYSVVGAGDELDEPDDDDDPDEELYEAP